MGCISSNDTGAKKDNVNPNEFDHLYKLVLVGDAMVGKSSLIIRYADNTFVDEEVGSIGADFKVSFVNVEKKRIKIQIWDTAGQEKFRVMTSSYFGGANAVIVVFDVSKEKSFQSVPKWISEAKRFSDKQKDIAFFIIGNKIDLNAQRVVSAEDAEKLAAQNAAVYFEVSAKTGTQVAHAFTSIAKTCFERFATPL